MKSFIYKIFFCISVIISAAYVFIPAGEGIFEDTSYAFTIINKEPAAFIGLDNIGLLKTLSIPLTIIIYWAPALLLIAAAILVFVRSDSRLSIVFTIVSVCIFVAADITCLINDTVYIGIFVNLIGVIWASAGMALCFIGDEDEEDEISGEITCLSGEYEGGKFYISDKLIIGHDASKCNIVLSDKTVSHVHCVISYISETDTYTVKDVSRNGTFFSDGKRLTKNFDMQVPRRTEIYMGENKERFILD